MKAIVIYNPTSGKEVFKNKIEHVQERLSAQYYVDVYATTGEHDAMYKASDVAHDYDLIVVAGGDGTLHEVICGISSKAKRPNIGYIPAGTVNDFANTLGIPNNIDQALDIILKEKPTPIDIGKMNDTYFVYVSAFGAFTKVSYTTPSKLKTALGKSAYFVQAVTEIGKIKSGYIELVTDDETIKGNFYVGLFVNSRGVASLKNIFPEAKLNDGLIDVILLPKTKRMVLPTLIQRFINGFRPGIKSDHIVHISTNHFKMTSNFNIKYNIDGESGIETNNVEVRCLKEHIRFHIPEKTKKDIII